MNLLQGQEAAAVDLHVGPEADEQVGQVHDFQREGRSQRKTRETRTIRKVDSGEKSAVLTSWFSNLLFVRIYFETDLLLIMIQ